MLRIVDSQSGVSRREFLSIGTLGLGGLSLSSLLAAKALGKTNPLTDKSIIFVFQQGGPSQFETFDPKIDAPPGIRTVTDTVQTSLPGVTFGDKMQQLAAIAHKLTVVRSFQTNNGGHNIQPLLGADTGEITLGALYSRVAGTTRPSTGMPTNTVLFPQSVSDKVTKGSARGDISSTGPYGKAYAPFIPGAGGQLQKNMRLNLPQKRFYDRQQVLSELDRINREVDASGQLEAMDKFQQQAYDVLLGGGVADALDLSKEDPQLVARYDTSRYARRDGWSKVNRGKRGYYSGHAKTFGKLLLLARRLCESGCGFVTVHAGYDGVWDMHADGNNLNMTDGMEAVGRSFDHGIAALIEDIERRGLSEKIMVVCCGEMGRTPRINKRGGRDHWGKLSPLLLYGGGIPYGQVIGQSTRDGGEPETENFTPTNLISTILHTVFDIGVLRVTRGVPDEVARLAGAEPISGLF